MNTSVTLDADASEALEAQAVTSGRRVDEVLSELIRQSFQKREAAETTDIHLPTFKVSSAAAVIPSDRAAKLLADDRE